MPSLTDGSGKELRRFHDTAKQHLRALKAMKEDPNGSFITALLELKLDKGTMFEWQKASQEAKKIPHYDDLLEFLNLRAQASKTCSSELKRSHSSRRANPKSATSFATRSHTQLLTQNPETPVVRLPAVQAAPT